MNETSVPVIDVVSIDNLVSKAVCKLVTSLMLCVCDVFALPSISVFKSCAVPVYPPLSSLTLTSLINAGIPSI